MEKITCRILSVLAIALVTAAVSGVASAQSEFTTTYFTNNTTPGAPAAKLRFSNDGDAGGKTLCAMIYVYRADQQIEACCGCPVTKNGLVEENVQTDLLGDPLTAKAPNQGVIQIIATTDPGVCDPTSTTATLAHGLTTWTTHIEDEVGTVFPITVTQNSGGALSAKEIAALQSDCLKVVTLGLGQGICTCNAEATN
jgi:hypothetical protein